MKKFMALYMAPIAEFEKIMAAPDSDKMKEDMADWEKWMKENEDSLVDGGAPLGKTKRVTAEGVSSVKNEIGGCSILEAESHDAAAELFPKNHPHFQMPGAYIEIIEIMPMPEM